MSSFSQKEGGGEQPLQLPATARRGELSPSLCQAVPSARRRWPSARRRWPSPVKPSFPPGWAVRLCFRGQRCRLSPHRSKRLRFQRRSAGGVKRRWAPRRELNLCQEQPDPPRRQPPSYLPCSAPSPGKTFRCCRSCRLARYCLCCRTI